MGHELLIASLAIRKGKSPNWDEAREAVRKFSDNYQTVVDAYLDAHGDEPDTDQILVDWLHYLVDAAEEAWKNSWRNSYVTDYIVPGWQVWIAGGESWGDTPCEEFDLINNLLNTGLAEKAGFVVRGY